MEQIPNWLAAAVVAAGMTAYADEIPKLPAHTVAPAQAAAASPADNPLD